MEGEERDILSKARAIQTKATPMSLRLCECIRNPSFPHVPTIFAKQITDAHTMFMTFIEKATIVINSDGEVAPALPDVKDARFLSQRNVGVHVAECHSNSGWYRFQRRSVSEPSMHQRHCRFQ